MSKKSIIAGLGLAISLLASTAQARLLDFSVQEGGVTVASWQQDTSLPPVSYVSGGSLRNDTVTSVSNFHLAGAYSYYSQWVPLTVKWMANNGSYGVALETDILSLSGPQIFAGPVWAPRFPSNEVITVHDDYFNTPATLTITSVPELSTWAMMGVGFAALGFAGYRRDKATKTAA